MMKSKITKYVVNGALLAVMAAAGITVYQLGTTPSVPESLPEEIQLESSLTETEEIPLAEDADTTHVEASMETEPSELVEKVETETDRENEEESEEYMEAEPKSTDVSASAVSLPALNFSEDTLMEWPVNGNILLDYSMDQTTYFPTLDQYKMSPAIAVRAVEGAPVMASAAGTVFSITEDAQTGTTVTMELGNGYQAIYGQLKDLTVAQGDTVTKGTIIGYINAPTKYYSTEGSNLYFAMKENGEPIDPIAYLP